MKKVLSFVAIAFAATALYSFVPAKKTILADEFTANTTNSKIEFIGAKKSGFHPGYFALKSGALQIENGKLKGGKFTIDVAGLKVTDGDGEKLEGHLKSPDFFDAAKFPEASFEILTVNYTSETAVEIAGNLNFRGVNIPLKFPAYIRSVDDKKFFAQAFFSLDATLLQFNYKNTMPDVQLAIHLFANK